MDYRSIVLISGLLFLLASATVVVARLRERPSGIDAGILSACRSRIYAYWLLFGALICAVLLGTTATVVLFGVISFWALREYVTLTPTRPADHRALVGVFFVLTPLQFFLVGVDSHWFSRIFGVDPYYVYSVLIPSLAFLILPAIIAASGDPKFFLERIAKLQVGLLICVYSLSFAPALITLNLSAPSKTSEPTLETSAVNIEERVLGPIEDVAGLQSANKEGETAENSGKLESQVPTSDQETLSAMETKSRKSVVTPHKKLNAVNLTLLFVFVFLTQVNDVSQYLWSLAFPKHKIAASVNSTKTTEGALLGALTTALVSTSLLYFTPFSNWRQAAFAGVIVSVMGFAGNMTISAIKRDQGVGDYDDLVQDHGGVLDRIDSLCFAAPVFFQYVRICANAQ